MSDSADGETVVAIGDRLAAQLIALDPLLATDWGVPSSGLPDLSPAWLQERRGLFASAAAALRARPGGPDDRLSAAMLLERADLEVDWIDSGEAHSELQAALDSPLFRIRYCFEEMPTECDRDWEGILQRLDQVPAALAGWRASLEVSRQSGPRAAQRQVEATADSLERWAGDGGASGAFGPLIGRRDRADDSLARALHASATSASSEFAQFAAYLRQSYLPTAPESDAVGSERFALWSRRYSGAEIGADDYAWAASVLADTSRDQARLRKRVAAAGPPLLITGAAEQLEWAERQIADAIRACEQSGLLAVDELRAIDVRPSPEGSTYYSPPSEDGARKAAVWFPTSEGSIEAEYSMTVLFHESVPGHHVEASFPRRNAGLSRFQRLVYIPAHSEGWALYAERLAEEVGLLATPRARFGCRGSQALRLASLLMDVGLHCELPPPAQVRDVVGERWTVQGAEQLTAAQGLDAATSANWVTNMIGRPGHRASYPTGERAWLAARAASSAAGEPPSEFHARVLGLGPLGLDLLRAEAAR